MTFSIVAVDVTNNEIGVAVASKFPAVGSIVPWIDLSAGAVATQAFVNSTYGKQGLKLMKAGATAKEVMQILINHDDEKEVRQVGIVDINGNAATFTGSECYSFAGGISGNGYAIQGNILVSRDTIESMEQVFLVTKGDLSEKLLSALEAGNSAGGDARGQQSAHLLVHKPNGGYGGGSDVYVDVRVDDNPQAVKELRRIFELYSMTLLEREDPNDITAIDEKLLKKISSKLLEIKFINTMPKTPEDQQKEFTKWMHTYNFENKERKDNYVWNSILNYLFSLTQ